MLKKYTFIIIWIIFVFGLLGVLGILRIYQHENKENIAIYQIIHYLPDNQTKIYQTKSYMCDGIILKFIEAETKEHVIIMGNNISIFRKLKAEK